MDTSFEPDSSIYPNGTLIADRYEITSFLAQGGMAQVYIASQQLVGNIHREVALKILLPAFSLNPDIVMRFFYEAKAIIRLNHPNTIKLYDMGETPDHRLFLAMELLKGKELSERIKDEKHPISPEEAFSIAKQVAGSLAEAHQYGIIHRDLKPDNIFITDLNVVKVLDFGIAKLKDDSEQSRIEKKLTKAGTAPGTPEYMSPEQARGKELDARSDLYSLGVVIYEMLCKHPPFEEPTSLGTILMHVQAPPPPLPDYIPKPMRDFVIKRLLAKNPNDRPKDAQAFINEVDELLRPTDQLYKAQAEIELLRNELAQTKLELLRSSDMSVIVDDQPYIQTPMPSRVPLKSGDMVCVNTADNSIAIRQYPDAAFAQNSSHYLQDPHGQTNPGFTHQPPGMPGYPVNTTRQRGNPQPPRTSQYNPPPSRQNYSSQLPMPQPTSSGEMQSVPMPQHRMRSMPNMPSSEMPPVPPKRMQPMTGMPSSEMPCVPPQRMRSMPNMPSSSEMPSVPPTAAQQRMRPMPGIPSGEMPCVPSTQQQRMRSMPNTPSSEMPHVPPAALQQRMQHTGTFNSPNNYQADANEDPIVPPAPRRSAHTSKSMAQMPGLPHNISEDYSMDHASAASRPKDTITGTASRNPTSGIDRETTFMMFAQPMVNKLGQANTPEILNLAKSIWNAAIMGPDALAALMESAKPKSNLRTLIELMVGRKLKYFAGESWIINELGASLDKNGKLSLRIR